MADTPEQRGLRIFQAAGYRCCSAGEFVQWYVGAQSVEPSNSSFYNPDYDPGSAAEFCLECHPLAQQEMAAQGRCVRLDFSDPGARDRVRRWRERKRAEALASAPQPSL